jgi:hypothetical protein
MQYWGVRMRFENREVLYLFSSRFQAEYYLIMIPAFMVSKNRMVRGIKSARLIPIL